MRPLRLVPEVLGRFSVMPLPLPLPLPLPFDLGRALGEESRLSESDLWSEEDGLWLLAASVRRKAESRWS